MTLERCDRCFGMIMHGKCACGKHTTVAAVVYRREVSERRDEDNLLHEILDSCPGYIDINDPTPIAFDSKTFQPLSAKELSEKQRLEE